MAYLGEFKGESIWKDGFVKWCIRLIVGCAALIAVLFTVSFVIGMIIGLMSLGG